MSDELEPVATFAGFYKRYSSNQTSQGGLELVLGVPKADVKNAIDLAETDGEMLVITVEKKKRKRLETPPDGPPDDHFRVWIGATDD